MAKRQPQQIWCCDSCGSKFELWDDKPWVQPSFAQILCESCKNDILANMERTGHFKPFELKKFFRQTKITQCKFK